MAEIFKLCFVVLSLFNIEIPLHQSTLQPFRPPPAPPPPPTLDRLFYRAQVFSQKSSLHHSRLAPYFSPDSRFIFYNVNSLKLRRFTVLQFVKLQFVSHGKILQFVMFIYRKIRIHNTFFPIVAYVLDYITLQTTLQNYNVGSQSQRFVFNIEHDCVADKELTVGPVAASPGKERLPLVAWEPFFCVLLQDEQTLTAYRSEELSVSILHTYSYVNPVGGLAGLYLSG